MSRYFKQQEGDEGDADDNNEMKLIVDMLSSHSGAEHVQYVQEVVTLQKKNILIYLHQKIRFTPLFNYNDILG